MSVTGTHLAVEVSGPGLTWQYTSVVRDSPGSRSPWRPPETTELAGDTGRPAVPPRPRSAAGSEEVAGVTQVT